MSPGRSFGSQLMKGMTPLLVLSVVAEREMYGYEIAQRIRDQTGGALALSEGSLYPTLHRLETDGALVATWRDSERGPRRRYYVLTEHGRGLLDRSRKEWSSFSRLVADVTVNGASGG